MKTNPDQANSESPGLPSAGETPSFRKDAKIQWYRCKVDPKLMSEFMKTSDFHGYRQALGHLVLWCCTGALAYAAFLTVHVHTLVWSLPLLSLALFAHGTVGAFLGGVACHELSHKTPFKNKTVNDNFLKVFAFLGWWDHVWFRPSHIRHHQVTVHHGYDGEVVLPMKLTIADWQFWAGLFAFNPVGIFNVIKYVFRRARGQVDNEWSEFVMPETNEALRREHRNWARITLIGHALLGVIFIVTGHWFLIVLVNFSTFYCGFLSFLCGVPQHFGMTPDVPDHRLSCRTFIAPPIVGFLYWSMQYHVEHHMFPAVPFYQLGKLRKAIAHDLPPALGLWGTWREILMVRRRQQVDPTYSLRPVVSSSGTHADDRILEKEAEALSA